MWMSWDAWMMILQRLNINNNHNQKSRGPIYFTCVNTYPFIYDIFSLSAKGTFVSPWRHAPRRFVQFFDRPSPVVFLKPFLGLWLVSHTCPQPTVFVFKMLRNGQRCFFVAGGDNKAESRAVAIKASLRYLHNARFIPVLHARSEVRWWPLHGSIDVLDCVQCWILWRRIALLVPKKQSKWDLMLSNLIVWIALRHRKKRPRPTDQRPPESSRKGHKAGYCRRGHR